MTAEEMFKKLGYNKRISKEYNIIIYSKVINSEMNEENIISLDLNNKTIDFSSYFCGDIVTGIFTEDEIKAVNKQIKELKKNGEW